MITHQIGAVNQLNKPILEVAMVERDFSQEKLKQLLNPHQLTGKMKLWVGIRIIWSAGISVFNVVIIFSKGENVSVYNNFQDTVAITRQLFCKHPTNKYVVKTLLISHQNLAPETNLYIYSLILAKSNTKKQLLS